MEAEHKNVQKHGRQLKTRPTIALLTHSISDAYGSLLWTGAMDAAREADANLICLPGWALNDERGFNAQANIIYELISTDMIDGLVFSSGTLLNYVGLENFLTFCKRYSLPMASIAVELEGIPSVLIENYERMLELMDHLIVVHNFTRFAYISGPKGNDEERDRYRGFVDSLEKHHLSQNPNLVSPPAQWDEASGVTAIRLFLDQRGQVPGKDFQAVVTGSDNLAFGALVELHSRNIPVPESVVLTGFDAQERSGYLTPPLTTVWQPIYEQARQATKLVLAQLRHETVLDKVMLPTKLVVRQSCGCPEPAVVKAKVGLIAKAVTTIKTALAISRSRRNILVEIANKVTDLSESISSEQAGRLLSAFYTELKGESSGNFLSTLDDTLRQVVVAHGDVSVWEEIISLMRREILPHINKDQALHVEDLFHQARVMIEERARRAQGYSRVEAEQRAGWLSEINQALVTSSDVQELMSILANGLSQLEIPACYLSLYENPAVPIKRCQLILAYNDKKGRIELKPDRQSFPSLQLVPDGFLSKEKSYSVVVEPLYFRENQLGIAVFEVGPRDGVVYQRLRGQLSSALWGAKIAYDNNKHTKELEHLQQASAKIASAADVREVLQQIVESAYEVLEADSVAIWSYDASRKTFLPDQLVTHGIPKELVEKSKLHKPRLHGTATAVIREGYLVVTDVDHVQYSYLGPEAHGLRRDIGVKSFQGIVLKVGDEVLGVLYVNYKISRGFDNQEESALKTFAYHAALALKKARLLERLNKVHQAARIVATESVLKKLQEILKAIAHSTESALGCDAVILYTYNQEKDEIEFPPAMAGVKNEAEVLKIGFVDKTSLNYKIINLDKLHVAEEATTDTLVKGPFVKREKIKSSVSIPLMVADRKVGVMFVNYRTPHHFNDEELADIELFAHQAAVAIRNAQLYDETTRKAQYLQALNEAGKTVTSTLALDEILQRIAEQASLLTAHRGQQPNFCNLILRENNILTFKVSYSASHISNLIGKGYIIDLEGDQRIGVVGRVVKTGKSQLVLDVTQDPDYIPGNPETKSLLAVPIIIGEEVVGVIALGHSRDGAFDEEDRNYLESLSTQAALAIRNAQLYDQATSKAQYLQSLYEAGKMVTSTLALDEILKSIVEQASLLTADEGQKAHFCYLALHENGKLKFKAAYPLGHKLRVTNEGYIIDLEGGKRIGIVGRAVKMRKSQLVMDVTQDPDYIPDDPETKSLLAVPIIIGTEVVGVIDVEYSSYNAFDEEDRDYLESLSTQAALAIRNAQLYEKTTTRATYLQALYDAGKTVTSTLALDEILQRIAEQASLLTAQKGQQAQFCYLGLKENNLLKFKTSHSSNDISGLLEQAYTTIDLEHDKRIGIVGRAVKQGTSCLVADVSADLDYIMVNPKTRSELAVPIKLGEDVIGVIAVEHLEPDAFDWEDAQALEALADQAAIAIRNARYVGEIRQRALQMQTASEVARDTASILNIEQLLDQAVKLISDRFHFYHTAIFLLEKEHAVLKAASLQGGQKMLNDRHKLKIGEDGIIGRVAKTGEPRIAPDVDKDIHFLRNRHLPGTRSEMALPLQIHGKPIGVLDVQSSEPNAFSKEDTTALQMMADQLAIAIHNAQMLTELERQYNDLKQIKGMVGSYTALDWMRMVSTVWGHSIKREVGKALASAELVRYAFEKGNHLQALQELEDLYRIIEEIKKIPITAPLSAEDEVSSVPINRIVHGYLQNQWKHALYKPVELVPELQSDLDSRGTVRASEAWLRRGLEIVVENAVQAMLQANSSKKQLSVVTTLIHNKIEILISDTGPGIPVEIQELIFKVPIEKPEGSKGAGVGCALAGNIFGAYQGSISVRETGPSGTVIAIILPIETGS